LVADGYKFFKHAAQADWKEKLLPRAELRKDSDDGKWKIEGIRYDNKPNPLILLVRKIAHGFRKIFLIPFLSKHLLPLSRET
jgi:hypothetical protein